MKAVFYGIRPAACGMIAAAGLSLAKSALLHLDMTSGSLIDIIDFPSIALLLVVYYLYNKYKKHPIFYIAGAAIAGILLKL